MESDEDDEIANIRKSLAVDTGAAPPGRGTAVPRATVVAAAVREGPAKLRRTIVDHAAATLKAPEPAASFGTTVCNMLKNVIASGFLSAPDVVKLGSIIPSVLVMVVAITATAATFIFIAVLSHKYEAKTYRQVWTKAVGKRFAVLVDVCVCFNSCLGCVSCCLLIGQMISVSLRSLIAPAFGNRVVNTLIISVVALFPLAIKRDLSSLRNTSLIGLLCSGLAVCFVVWQAAAHWHEQVPSRACKPFRGSGCTSGEVLSASLWHPSAKKLALSYAICASMLGAQYNVPRFYSELEGRTPAKFAKAVTVVCIITFTLLCAFSNGAVLRLGNGFGNGNVLKHFQGEFPPKGIMSQSERVTTLLLWLAMAFNILATYPLLFSPLRVCVLQLCGTSVADLTPHGYIKVTVGLIAATAAASLCIQNLTFVQKVKGAVCGSSIAYVIPGIMLWYESKPSGKPWMRIAAGTSIVFGCSFGAYGLLLTFKVIG